MRNHHIKNFEKFNEAMFTDVFKTDYDETLKNLFNKIKLTFNLDNLIDLNDVNGTIQYNLDGVKIGVRDRTFFGMPGYNIRVDGENIESSFFLTRKIYKFLKSKRDIKYKESDKLKVDLKRKKDIENNEIRIKKEKDKIDLFKTKYK